MLKNLILTLCFMLSLGVCALESPEANLKSSAGFVDVKEVRSLMVQDQGRLKPFDTFTREAILFIAGKYSLFSLNANELYLSIIVNSQPKKLEIVNIRNTALREQLGFAKDKQRMSINQLDKTSLFAMAKPLIEKREKNKRTLEPAERDLLEVYSQYWFLKNIISGDHFFSAIDFSGLLNKSHRDTKSKVIFAANEYLKALAQKNREQSFVALKSLKEEVKAQPLPDLFKPHVARVPVEVLYNQSKIFLISAILILLFGISLYFEPIQKLFQKKLFRSFFFLPIVSLSVGFALRVYITGFAPVTNMYGTMLWVSLGILLFSLFMLFAYKNFNVVASLWVASGLVILLTESMPLILSPNMDPVVAVLRSNLWLTIHVLTIVISYAAFTITMVLGNIVLIRNIFNYENTKENIKEYAKYIYRMTQLGAFLLAVGIILGGVWADYSWGRFWGWDPKETWALIANLGYLIILHAKYAGWLTPFGLAASSAVAYLLVIMAWYGVNFILASGLHSYGFSSGGTAFVMTFVLFQLVIVGISLAVRAQRAKA
ncbi:MAG: cytochrome c biogenesis protein CcsA [Bdellovibrionaceae bacterium]|jgi:ABC-type transport system involved in cytochrome c biogenesis permease subunit|nr:cytochrome c biogenesis protein CcsA [Pseudobdellovibrionaceae bacterium]